MNLTNFCMSVTPFSADGNIDERALRLHLQRMVKAGVGVYLGSGGAGEGHALSRAELRRVYEIGVDECRGKIPVYANPPEPRTAMAMLEVVALATGAGVDVVQVYPLDGGHGMRPTEPEQLRYYQDVLSQIDHPVALSVHTVVGYAAPAALIARLCRDFPRIVAINLIGVSSTYLIELRAAIRKDIAIYVPVVGFFEAQLLGANGFLGAEANIIPNTCTQLARACTAHDYAAAALIYAQLLRFAKVVDRWAPSSARWAKMALKALDLPGGEGGLRLPYLMPGEPELRELRESLLGIGIDELGPLSSRA